MCEKIFIKIKKRVANDIGFVYNNMATETIHRGVEQLVARRAHNPKVVGSSPASATNNANRFRYRSRKVRNHSGFGLFLYEFSQLNFIDILSLNAYWGGIELQILNFIIQITCFFV